jgi:hypothetical protein
VGSHRRVARRIHRLGRCAAWNTGEQHVAPGRARAIAGTRICRRRRQVSTAAPTGCDIDDATAPRGVVVLDRHSSAGAECVGFRCFETRDDEPEARLTVGSALLICKASMTAEHPRDRSGRNIVTALFS